MFWTSMFEVARTIVSFLNIFPSLTAMESEGMRTARPEDADSMEVALILGEGMTLIENVHDREAGHFTVITT